MIDTTQHFHFSMTFLSSYFLHSSYIFGEDASFYHVSIARLFGFLHELDGFSHQRLSSALRTNTTRKTAEIIFSRTKKNTFPVELILF